MLAKKERTIHFYGKYSPLSNFYYAGFIWKGKRYATVEHYFQAMKTNDPDWREKIRLAASPVLAKRLGRHVQLQKNWERKKEQIMMKGLRLKFDNPIMREALLKTGQARLVEDSAWDKYWGGRDDGRNRLGILLMRLRKELQNESDGS